MKFVFLFPGKTRSRYLDDGIRDYATRLQRYVPVEMVFLREKHSRNDSDRIIIRKEAEQLLSCSRRAPFRVALDPGGLQPDSEELAAMMQKWEDRSLPAIYFLTGGHLGLDRSVLREADQVLSLSRLTFTHEMTRLILMEQLYRACTIRAGHNYHK